MKKLSLCKFANNKMERNFLKFWLNASPEEQEHFQKIFLTFPISSFIDGVFGWELRGLEDKNE